MIIIKFITSIRLYRWTTSMHTSKMLVFSDVGDLWYWCCCPLTLPMPEILLLWLHVMIFKDMLPSAGSQGTLQTDMLRGFLSKVVGEVRQQGLKQAFLIRRESSSWQNPATWEVDGFSYKPVLYSGPSIWVGRLVFPLKLFNLTFFIRFSHRQS